MVQKRLDEINGRRAACASVAAVLRRSWGVNGVSVLSITMRRTARLNVPSNRVDVLMPATEHRATLGVNHAELGQTRRLTMLLVNDTR